jgi:hypothetical protein
MKLAGVRIQLDWRRACCTGRGSSRQAFGLHDAAFLTRLESRGSSPLAFGLHDEGLVTRPEGRGAVSLTSVGTGGLRW